MIFALLLQWIRVWYDCVLWPMLTIPYFYMLIMFWLVLSLSTTYLFFYFIDSARLKNMKHNLMFSVMKAAGFGLLVSMALVSLYDLALFFAGTSKFFATQKSRLLTMGIFGIPGGMCCPTLFGQCWQLIQRIMTVFFCIFTTLLAPYFVADVAYHLEENRVWWNYFGLISLVSVACYLFFMLWGYI